MTCLDCQRSVHSERLLPTCLICAVQVICKFLWLLELPAVMSIAWLLPTLRDGHLNFALSKIVAAPGQGAVGGFWQSRGKWCFVVLSTFPRLVSLHAIRTTGCIFVSPL